MWSGGTAQPDHGDFIAYAWTDWLSPSQDDLWESTTSENNPCPSGFRVPTQEKWTEEILTWTTPDPSGAFSSPLRLTTAGRRLINGTLEYQDTDLFYWTSTAAENTGIAWALHVDDAEATVPSYYRMFGMTIRCIKD